MSGAEVLGLVTGVMTVITFASDLCKVGKAVYNGASIDDDLLLRATALEHAAKRMQKETHTVKPQTLEETRLVSVAKECQKVATDILKEVGVGKSDTGSVRNSIIRAVKSAWSKSALEKLEKRMNRQKDIFKTEILMPICTKSDVAILQQTEYFCQLNKDFREFIERQAAKQAETEALAQAEHQETRKQQVKIIRQAQTSIIHDLKHVEAAKSTEEQRQIFLKSLKFSGMNERRNHVKVSHEGTFKWVLEQESQESPQSFPSFPKWLESKQEMYWVSGKPGSGKSTLMKYIIEHPKTLDALQKWHHKVSILSHYFWKPGGGMQRNIKGLWCSFAYQHFSNDQEDLEHVLKHHADFRSKQEPSDWSVAQVKGAFQDALARRRPAICFFIDGLDEIEDADGVSSLRGAISGISRANKDKVKFCFASRSENRFHLWLQNVPIIRLHTLNHSDMMEWTKHQLSSAPNEVPEYAHNGWLLDMSRKLVEKAEGVFIWLVLATKSVIRGLEEENSLSEISERIDSLPGEIEALYTDMWQRLNGDNQIYRKQAAEYFQLIIHRQTIAPGEGMHLEEITIATMPEYQAELSQDSLPSQLDPSVLAARSEMVKRRIEIRSAGLLEAVTSSEKETDIRFIHRTCYDYLTMTSFGREILSFDQNSITEWTTRLCKTWWAAGLLHEWSRPTQKEEYYFPNTGWGFYRIHHTAEALHWAAMKLTEPDFNRVFRCALGLHQLNDAATDSVLPADPNGLLRQLLYKLYTTYGDGGIYGIYLPESFIRIINAIGRIHNAAEISSIALSLHVDLTMELDIGRRMERLILLAVSELLKMGPGYDDAKVRHAILDIVEMVFYKRQHVDRWAIDSTNWSKGFLEFLRFRDIMSRKILVVKRPRGAELENGRRFLSSFQHTKHEILLRQSKSIVTDDFEQSPSTAVAGIFEIPYTELIRSPLAKLQKSGGAWSSELTQLRESVLKLPKVQLKLIGIMYSRSGYKRSGYKSGSLEHLYYRNTSNTPHHNDTATLEAAWQKLCDDKQTEAWDLIRDGLEAGELEEYEPGLQGLLAMDR